MLGTSSWIEREGQGITRAAIIHQGEWLVGKGHLGI